MDITSRSSSDKSRNNSGDQKINDNLDQLRQLHHRFYNPDAEKLPNPLETLNRRIRRLNPIPRKIRVGRETQKIIGHAYNLCHWIKESAEGKGIEIKRDEIDTIRWLVSRASDEHSLALRPKDGGTGQDDKPSREAALTQLTRTAQELQAWDNYRQGRGDQPSVRREIERRKNIERLLEQLPTSRPTLSDLPQNQWWKLHTDKADRKEAEKLSNPGMLYDKTGSPGYQQGMIELFNKVLVTREANREKKISYKEYTQRHEYATAYVPDDNVPDFGKRSFMREPNGLDRDNPTGYSSHFLLPREDRRELQEQLNAIEEMRGELYNNLPLFQDWSTGGEQPNEPTITVEIAKALPQGIVIGQKITTDSFILPEQGGATIPKGTIFIRPLYSPEEGSKHVDAILNSYYERREVPGQTPYDRIREIARTVRALHVLHQKLDANGRTNMNGVLNELLQEEGFSPIIFSSEPSDFRGYRTLDGLTEDILTGMHTFIEEVNQQKQ